MENKKPAFNAGIESLLPFSVALGLTSLLVVKSAFTALLFALALAALSRIIADPTRYFSGRSKRFWMMVFSFASPFVCALLAQIGRGSFVASALDGPSRWLLSACVFVYLSRSNNEKLITAIGWGAAGGIVAVTLSISVFPDYYWGHRAATYFVDPITLPCYVVALLGLALFIGLPGLSIRLNNLCKFVLYLMTLYVALESYSRSSWAALVALSLAYSFFYYRGSLKKQLMTGLSLCCFFVLIYFCSDVVSSRIDLAVSGATEFVTAQAGQDTSTGHRLIMLILDYELLISNPWFGVQDGLMPPFSELLAKYPFLTYQIYEIKQLAGSHSELTGQMVRHGVLLGFICLWALYFYPYFICFHKSEWLKVNFSVSGPELFVGFLVVIFTSSLTIQVFNLKMTASFYSFCVAVCFACNCFMTESRKVRDVTEDVAH